MQERIKNRQINHSIYIIQNLFKDCIKIMSNFKKNFEKVLKNRY